MKAIMISIRPEFVEKILNKEKMIEVRKTKPKCELPCKVYIYCTKGSRNNWLRVYPFNIRKNIYQLCDDSFNALNETVVAEFTLNKIDKFNVFENGSVQYWNCYNLEKGCLTYDKIAEYVGYNKVGYAWHIDNLKIYDNPKELSAFSTTLHRMKGKQSRYTSHLLQRPPQSYMFVEELEEV